ncbi:hypothetical protein KNSL1_000705 [Colletotrichum chrysophilum]|nr:hypothetical protein KNSL1_000705 [Colletotrichum chrysophilum]
MSSSHNNASSSNGSSRSQAGEFLEAQDENESRIIQVMNKVRALDNHDVVPHQLVVCGSQSSGKSSVLGAITGIPFPSGRGMCTRYVVEVTLAYSANDYLSITIKPGPKRTKDERRRLKGFEKKKERLVGNPEGILINYVEEAHRLIFAGTEDEQSISEDILAIKMAGPRKRALHLVDLPGLIATHDNDELVKTIKDKVQRYIEMENTTILAVVDGSVDLELSGILQMCKESDRLGDRTHIIVTKPDLPTTIPDSIVAAVNRNNKMPYLNAFRFHVLRNIDKSAPVSSTPLNERRTQEEEVEEFFNQPQWVGLPKENRGIEQLRHYEYRVSVREEGGPEYPRSRIVEHERRFKANIEEMGYAWVSHAKLQPLDARSNLSSGRMPTTTPVSFSLDSPKRQHANLDEEVDMVSSLLEKTKGTEPEGFENPDRINLLFWKSSEKWPAIAERHVDEVFTCCKEYLRENAKMGFSRTEDSIAFVTKSDGFANADIVATRFLDDYVVEKLSVAKKKARDELARLNLDRKSFLHDRDDRFIAYQQNSRHGTGFGDWSAAIRHGAAVNSNGLKEMNAKSVAQQKSLTSSEGERKHVAKDHLHTMQLHYNIKALTKEDDDSAAETERRRQEQSELTGILDEIHVCQRNS